MGTFSPENNPRLGLTCTEQVACPNFNIDLGQELRSRNSGRPEFLHDRRLTFRQEPFHRHIGLRRVRTHSASRVSTHSQQTKQVFFDVFPTLREIDGSDGNPMALYKHGTINVVAIRGI
jgi:hypothetical protein